jgi:succinyl-diaminopimelate desuccinylase
LRDVIVQTIDGMREEIVSLTSDLTRFPTIATTGQSYVACTDYIADRLAEVGLQVEKIEVPREYLESVWGANLEKSKEYLEVKALSPRIIVLGKWSGAVPKPSLHLTQHYDTTEPRGSSFEPIVKDEKIFGKAISQARAGTVSQITAVRALRQAGVELRGNLFVSATPDNHVGGDTGAKYMVDKGYGKSDFVITGGPSGADVVTLGYKGCLWIKVTTTGKSAHGSEPHEGINAIEKMMKIQNALYQLDQRYARRKGKWPVDPAESNRPTLTMSRIIAEGVTVPAKCSLYLDRRVNPEETVDDAVNEIRDEIAKLQEDDEHLKAEIEVLHIAENAVTSGDGKLAKTLMKNIEETLKVKAKTAVWTYYTEFRCFPTRWGAETVNYSPGLPKVYRGPNEYVVIDDLVAGSKVLALTILDLIGPDAKG